MRNSLDQDQTLPQKQSDLGLHCMPQKRTHLLIITINMFKIWDRNSTCFNFAIYQPAQLLANIPIYGPCMACPLDLGIMFLVVLECRQALLSCAAQPIPLEWLCPFSLLYM